MPKIQAQEQVEAPKIMQQGVDTHAQHVACTAEVEEANMKTAQLPTEVPKITPQAVNTYAQYVAEVEEPNMKTAQLPTEVPKITPQAVNTEDHAASRERRKP